MLKRKINIYPIIERGPLENTPGNWNINIHYLLTDTNVITVLYLFLNRSL